MKLENKLRNVTNIAKGFVLAAATGFVYSFFTPNAKAQMPPVPMETRGFLAESSYSLDSVLVSDKRTGQFLNSTYISNADTVTASGDTVTVPGFVRLVVPSDDVSTPQVEGARSGDTLFFLAKDFEGKTYDVRTSDNLPVIHEPGKIKRVDLRAIGPTGVFDNEYVNVPRSFQLFQNYPNPFNSSTVVSYELPTSGKISLLVYDILGRRVETLVDQKQESGLHSVNFEGRGLSSGVYFLRLISGEKSETKKMSLIK